MVWFGDKTKRVEKGNRNESCEIRVPSALPYISTIKGLRKILDFTLDGEKLIRNIDFQHHARIYKQDWGGDGYHMTTIPIFLSFFLSFFSKTALQ